MGEQRVCLGEVVGPHGVKGLVRVRTFTEEPEAVTGYGQLQDQQGRPMSLAPVGRAKGVLLAVDRSPKPAAREVSDSRLPAIP